MYNTSHIHTGIFDIEEIVNAYYLHLESVPNRGYEDNKLWIIKNDGQSKYSIDIYRTF